MRSVPLDSMTRALVGLSAAPQAMSRHAAPLCPTRGRPAGDLSVALLSAAAQSGPATVRELAERACVGYAAARYTSSRLVSRGELVALHEGRPMVLAVSADLRSFWAESNLKRAEP
jgi:hypothetical protein